jgi:hypothetical protein
MARRRAGDPGYGTAPAKPVISNVCDTMSPSTPGENSGGGGQLIGLGGTSCTRHIVPSQSDSATNHP